jgi:hypothetical protein
MRSMTPIPICVTQHAAPQYKFCASLDFHVVFYITCKLGTTSLLSTSDGPSFPLTNPRLPTPFGPFLPFSVIAYPGDLMHEGSKNVHASPVKPTRPALLRVVI